MISSTRTSNTTRPATGFSADEPAWCAPYRGRGVEDCRAMVLPIRKATLTGAFTLSILVSLHAGGVPASAETPSAVAVELADDGVYRSPQSTQIDEATVATLAAAVVRAKASGLNLVVLAPSDPQPDAESFALRVRQATEADVALLFATDGALHASVTDAYSDRMVRSVEEARQAPGAAAAVEAFVAQLTTEPDRGLPPTVRLIIGVVVGLVIVLIASTALEQAFRRRWPHAGR